MPTELIDIITPLRKLQATAEHCSDSAYVAGYLLGIAHALEIAEIMQLRLDAALALKQEAQ